MSTSSVHPAFGLLRTAATLRSPLGSARGSLSSLHPIATLAIPAGSAPCCPLPSRPRSTAGHPIPTWEELLGER